MGKKTKQERRTRSESHNGPVTLVSPIYAAVERPVTTAELAKHLSVTPRTLATYRAERKIPFWRINSRQIRYRISDVERDLARNRV